MALTVKNIPLLKKLSICLACAAVASIIFYFLSESYIISQAEKNIQNLLLSHRGIHHYVQKRMLPALYEYKKQQKIPADFYAPELFSSSFIVRNQHEYYNQELAEAGFPVLYYKLAANNPRNPVNQADALEKAVIAKFNQDRSLKKYREIITVDGAKHLYFALPFLENDQRCLVCHGPRENAPLELQEKYPGEGGFNEKIGEIRAITSIRAPLNQEYHTLYILFPSLAIGIFALFFLTFFNNQLRSKVRQSTESLKAEVIEKQEIASRLEESEEYLKSIQDSMQVGLLLIEQTSDRIVDVNKIALKMINLPKERVIGQQHFSFLRPSSANGEPMIDHQLSTDNSERVLWDAQGNKIPILNTATRIRHNHTDYILETFIDITEQKEMAATKVLLEKQLNQAQKMEALGTLAGGIAHDFNNLLTVIIGFAEIAKDHALPESGELADDLDKILLAGFRARDLVQQILTFSRQSKSTRYPLEPGPIVKEVLKMLHASLPATITIEDKIAEDCGVIAADPTQIHQILMNLCTNAFHAMEEKGGTLTIEMRGISTLPAGVQLDGNQAACEAYLSIAVSDTGHGIRPEIKDKIFDPFFTTKAKGKGTGLGLSTTFGIIKDYGGSIKVESQVGKGSTFQLYIPASKAKTVPANKTAPNTPVGKERILFIDDEELVVNLEKQALGQLGYSVTALKSGLEALELFQQQPDRFDLVITDQTMPGITGSELAELMLRIRPDIPIILCTGYSNLIDEIAAKAIGIREYALKPLTKSAMAKLIRKVLDPA